MGHHNPGGAGEPPDDFDPWWELGSKKKRRKSVKKLKKQLASDIGQLILDITGIIDPPHPVFSGGTNALRVLARGRWLDALDGTVNIASYIGDESKAAKMPGYSKSIRRARELALDHGHWAARLHDVFFPLRTLLDKALALGADEIPVVTRRHLQQMRDEIDFFVTPHSEHVRRATAREMAEFRTRNSGPSTSSRSPKKAKTESETSDDALEEPNQDNNSGEDNIRAEPRVVPNNHGEAPWDHANWDDAGLVEKLLVSTGHSVSKVSEVLGSLASWSSDTEQRFDEIGADPNTPEPLRLAVATLKLPARIGTGIVSSTAGLADLVLNPDSRAQLYDGLAQLYEKPEILDNVMADFAGQPKHEIASDVLVIAAELAMGGKVVSTLRKRGKKTAAPKGEDGVPNKQILGQADSRPIQIQGNVDELDLALLRLDGQAIIDNQFLGRVRSQLDNYDVTVNYNYGRAGDSNFGETTKYLDGRIEIDVFKQNAFKSQDSLTTYVHESSHAVAAARGREIGTLADEYHAFRREFVFINGRRPTFTERRNLFDSVQRVYDDVPTGNVAPLFQDLVR